MNTELFIVIATDADEPGTSNVDVTFTLADSSLPFSIDSMSGNLTTRTVAPDLEVRTYNVVVIAADNGNPPLNSRAPFYVIVAAPNFHDPIFPDELMFPVEEEEIPADAVFEFMVFDADVGDEGRVSLTLLPSDYSDAFNLTFFYDDALALTVGHLYQVDSFDRESVTNFTLPVRAIDQGNELFRRTSEATIMVTVSDVNDNSPIFINSPYTARVAEDSDIGTFALLVVAEDIDSGTNAEIIYQIDGNVNDFTIDEESGNITINANLERRRQSFYSFNVTVTDRGIPSLSNTTTVEIDVTEVNDNKPFFDPLLPITITIPEDTEPGYVLLNITAMDNDTLSAGEVTISLGQSGRVFDLKNGNQLILNQMVDFEVRK